MFTACCCSSVVLLGLLFLLKALTNAVDCLQVSILYFSAHLGTCHLVVGVLLGRRYIPLDLVAGEVDFGGLCTECQKLVIMERNHQLTVVEVCRYAGLLLGLDFAQVVVAKRGQGTLVRRSEKGLLDEVS